MKKLITIFILMLSINIFSFERIDIGEIQGNVFISLNEVNKTYEITGSVKISKDKFREYLKTIKNSYDYTIEIKEETVLFPDDSSELFYKGNGEYLDVESKIPVNMNTINLTNMSYMFSDLVNGDTNVSNWNTSSVTDMTGMFSITQNANPDVSIGVLVML